MARTRGGKANLPATKSLTQRTAKSPAKTKAPTHRNAKSPAKTMNSPIRRSARLNSSPINASKVGESTQTDKVVASVEDDVEDVTDMVVYRLEDDVEDVTDMVIAETEKNNKRKSPVEETAFEEDDNGCEIAEDDDFDQVKYADETGVEEEVCGDFVGEFGEAAREEELTDADSGDDIWEEDKIPERVYSSDDEGVNEEEGNNETPEGEDDEELLKLGKTFNSPEDFKIAVLRYSLKSRYDIKLYKSESWRVGAKCSDKENKCPWKCYCSYDKKKHKMQVKIYINEHSCVRSGYSKMLKQSAIAWLFSERLRMNPKIRNKDMVEEIKREYNLCVTDDQCSKAKTQVLREKRACHQLHFARVWDYQAEIFRSNQGSIFEIETVPGTTIGSLQRFFRLFICFKSQRDTWKSTCRPIIGVDGAFLKWDVKGHLLAAVGRDGDNRIVPIAWAIVEIESDDNWDWFFRLLSRTLDLQDGRNLAVISDKQSGLVKAIHTVLPEAEHRLCARHIMENWKRGSHDMELQRIFWRIAQSYTEGEYTGYMAELKRYNTSAFESLLKTNPEKWSRAFFKIGSCCNDNLNNLSESFNRTIRLARRKPLLDLLEEIRRQCMERNEKRYVVAGRLRSRFTRRAHIEIEKMIAGSQHCQRWMARHNKHEVRLGDDIFSVDMNEKTCGCRKWQMTGIPCEHAASVIIGQKLKVEDYVSDWYTTSMWQQTYVDGIVPVQSMQLWPRVNKLGVLPPPWRGGNPGRPKNHDRRKSQFETASSSSNTVMSRVNRVMTCSNCKEEGHNKQGCTNPSVPKPPKKKRGRPKKNQEDPRMFMFGQAPIHEASTQEAPTTYYHGASSQPVPSQAQAPHVGRGRARARGRGGRGVSQRGRGASRGAVSEGEGLGPGGQGGLEGWEPWFNCSR